VQTPDELNAVDALHEATDKREKCRQRESEVGQQLERETAKARRRERTLDAIAHNPYIDLIDLNEELVD